MKTINFLSTPPKRYIVRNIATLSIVISTLFFTATSCGKDDDSGIFETYAWVVYQRGCGYILIGARNFLGPQPSLPLTPTNLQRRYQKDGLQVRITFQYTDRKRFKCGNLIIRILTIEEVILTSRFFVYEYNGCFLLVEDREHHNPNQRTAHMVIDLPEEYRKNGIRVDITFRRRRNVWPCPHPPSYSIFFISANTIEIISITETRGECTQTRTLGGFWQNPWQVLLSQTNNQYF